MKRACRPRCTPHFAFAASKVVRRSASCAFRDVNSWQRQWGGSSTSHCERGWWWRAEGIMVVDDVALTCGSAAEPTT